tara:strand:- start:42075 stop:43058 length:984 start_codon:yes stop_codon:yes gene_type:complete
MINILIAILGFLLIVTLVQVVRVSELLSEIKNQDANEVTFQDNKIQSRTLGIVGFLFLASCVWQYFEWKHVILPPASSEHGAIIDSLMAVTVILITIVFFITQIALFYFGFKYRKDSDNETAFFYSHNNKLEMFWTVIPAIVLTGVILYGLNVWNKINNTDTSNASVIELYAKQFGWEARYAGEDGKLGDAYFKYVNGPNTLGVNLDDQFSMDDIQTKEVHLVVGKPVLLKMRSQDVIHSAFLPHFRVQMNCVPGMTTQFAFTPTKTTKQMKEEEGEDFEYVLLCNKICGAAHYNMQMKFIVEEAEEYNTWIKNQETIKDRLLTQNN